MPRQSTFTLSGPCRSGLTSLKVGQAGIYRDHGLSAWTLNRTSAGCGIFSGPDSSFTTKVGDLVLIAPQVLNDYGPAPGHHWQHQWAVFRPDEGWQELLAWPQLFPGHHCLRRHDDDTDAGLDELFRYTIQVTKGLHPRRHEASLSLVKALLTIACAWRDTSQSGPDQRLKRAMNAAADDLQHPWSIDELAAVSGLSPSRFAHRFRAEIGLSPRQWLERRRIRAASDRLLMSGEAVASIAHSVGFTDAAYFTRIFRRLTGTTPSSWRRDPGLRK